MRTSWNEREDDAMHGLPHMAQLTYLRALRPYMDYATGIVGIKRGISLKSISEMLHVESGQGRREYGDPSTKAVRYALDLLERAGLIEKKKADRQLVFRLPLADMDSSVSEKWGRRGADVGQTKCGTPDTSNDADSAEKYGRRVADPNPEKWGTPPVSGIRDKTEGKPSDAGASRDDPKTAVWNLGERLLGSRAHVGKLIKQHGEPNVFHAIAQAAFHNPADARAYIVGMLTAKTKPPPGRQSVADTNRAALDTWLNGHEQPETSEIIEGEFRREAI